MLYQLLTLQLGAITMTLIFDRLGLRKLLRSFVMRYYDECLPYALKEWFAKPGDVSRACQSHSQTR